MGYTKTVSGIVEQPALVVWEIITNPRKFHGLKILGTYDHYHHGGDPAPGATFDMKSLQASERHIKHVIDCVQHREFSFGDSPAEWDYRFKLEERGTHTLVEFTRDFRPPALMERISYSSKCEKTATKTLDALIHACKRLRDYGDDGICPS